MILSHLTAPLRALARGAALATVLALPAAAATMQAVYTGTVYSGYDETGAFGAASTSLDGAAFTATFRYDTTLGVIDAGGYYTGLYGGTYFGTTPPMTYAAFTINGVTQTLDVSNYDYIVNYNEASLGGTQTQTYHYGQGNFDDGLTQYNGYLYAYLGSGDGSLAVPLDLTQPFTAVVDSQNGSQYGYGSFVFSVYDLWTGTYTENAYASFAPTKVVVSTIGAVPLPASLPLLAFALGGLAVVARRRRVTAA